jgi:hypothetical protein
MADILKTLLLELISKYSFSISTIRHWLFPGLFIHIKNISQIFTQYILF